MGFWGGRFGICGGRFGMWGCKVSDGSFGILGWDVWDLGVGALTFGVGGLGSGVWPGLGLGSQPQAASVGLRFVHPKVRGGRMQWGSEQERRDGWGPFPRAGCLKKSPPQFCCTPRPLPSIQSGLYKMHKRAAPRKGPGALGWERDRRVKAEGGGLSLGSAPPYHTTPPPPKKGWMGTTGHSWQGLIAAVAMG